MKIGTPKVIKNAIEKYDNIFIFHHIRPDGDCLGSQFALKELIQKNYPNKKVFAIGDNANSFNFMVLQHDVFQKQYLRNSLAIVVDTANIDRVFNKEILLQNNFTSLAKIDHHPQVEEGINYKYKWIDPSYVASAEQIGTLAKTSKWEVTPKAAEYIYLGIYTDSNRFFYSNTSERTFALVSWLMKQNLNIQHIHENLSIRTKEELKIQAYVLSHFKTKEHVAYLKIDQNALKKLGFDIDTVAQQVNLIANIKNYPIWLFMLETETGDIRVRLRSSGPQINIVAQEFRGGGHNLASGATLHNWKEADPLLKKCNTIAKKWMEEKSENW